MISPPLTASLNTPPQCGCSYTHPYSRFCRLDAFSPERITGTYCNSLFPITKPPSDIACVSKRRPSTTIYYNLYFKIVLPFSWLNIPVFISRNVSETVNPRLWSVFLFIHVVFFPSPFLVFSKKKSVSNASDSLFMSQYRNIISTC